MSTAISLTRWLWLRRVRVALVHGLGQRPDGLGEHLAHLDEALVGQPGRVQRHREQERRPPRRRVRRCAINHAKGASASALPEMPRQSPNATTAKRLAGPQREQTDGNARHSERRRRRADHRRHESRTTSDQCSRPRTASRDRHPATTAGRTSQRGSPGFRTKESGRGARGSRSCRSAATQPADSGPAKGHRGDDRGDRDGHDACRAASAPEGRRDKRQTDPEGDPEQDVDLEGLPTRSGIRGAIPIDRDRGKQKVVSHERKSARGSRLLRCRA